MGEILDPTRILVTGPQELARAKAFRVAQAQGAKAKAARVKALSGSTAARKDLTARWAATSLNSVQVDMLANATVYKGEGPPPEPVPAGTPVGAWYVDTLTNDLYRLET